MKVTGKSRYILYILIYNYLYNKTEENKEAIFTFLEQQNFVVEENLINELISKFFTKEHEDLFGEELVLVIKMIINAVNSEISLTEEELWLFKFVNVAISQGVNEEDLQSVIDNGVSILENDNIPFNYKRDLYTQIIFLISRKPSLENLEKANKYLELIKNA